MAPTTHSNALDDLVPDGPPCAAPLSTRPTHELVVDLSQLEFALRARQGRNAWGSVAQADATSHALVERKHAIVDLLRSRGLDFTTGSTESRQPMTSPRQIGATRPVSQSRRITELEARLDQLERTREAEALDNQAVGILMERHRITSDEAALMLQLATGAPLEEPGALAEGPTATGGLLPVGSWAAQYGPPSSGGRFA